MLKIFLSGLCCLLFQTLAVLSPVLAEDLSLARAFEIAQQSNRGLAAAAARQAEQTAALQAARAQRLPGLEFSQRITRVDNSTVERANSAAVGLSQLIGFEIPPFVFQDSYRTQFSLNAPLWTGGRIAATIEREKRNLSAAEAEEDVAWRTARLDVTRSFFTLASSQAVLGARRQAVRRAERRLLEAMRRLDLGLTTRQEVLRWQVEVERGQADLADAESALFISRLELADRLNLAEDAFGDLLLPDDDALKALVEWADTLQPRTTLIEAESSLDDLPEIQVALARLASQEADLERSRSARMPRLEANAAYGWLENETLELDEFENWSATLQLTVPIDLRGDLKAEIRREKARLAGAQVSTDDTRAALRLELGRAIAEMVRTRTRLRSNQRAADEAAARRELLGRQAEVGLTGLLDLIDADATLVAAELDLARARVDLLSAVAELELIWPAADPPAGGLIP